MKLTRHQIRLIALMSAMLLIFPVFTACSAQGEYTLMGMKLKVPAALSAEASEEKKDEDTLFAQSSLCIKKANEAYTDNGLYGMIEAVDKEQTAEDLKDKLAEGETLNQHLLKDGEGAAQRIAEMLTGGEAATEARELTHSTFKVGDIEMLDVRFVTDFMDVPMQYRVLTYYSDKGVEYTFRLRWPLSAPAGDVKLLDDMIDSIKIEK